MEMVKRAAATAALGVAAAASGQVILVNDTLNDVCYVLDAQTGDWDGTTFPTNFASSNTGVSIIDGPGGGLLISDQLADTIYQLDCTGALQGDFIDAPQDNIRGLNVAPGGIVIGCTINGIYAWNSDGSLRSEVIGESKSWWDVEFVEANRLIVATTSTDDNVQAYNLNLGLVAESAPGGIDFPEQMNFISTPNGLRLAVGSFSDDAVVVLNLDGTEDYRIPLPGDGEGVVQLGSGNLLITGDAISEYTVDGTFLRDIATGGSFRFAEVSFNYCGQ